MVLHRPVELAYSLSDTETTSEQIRLCNDLSRRTNDGKSLESWRTMEVSEAWTSAIARLNPMGGESDPYEF